MYKINQFITNGNNIKSILGLNQFEPNHDNLLISTYTQKLGDNPLNNDILFNCLKQNSTSLVIAPTGSGKTYSMKKITDKLYTESDEKNLIIVSCPNKIQNLQNEITYNMSCLIKGSKDLLDYNIEQNETTFSAVYEKIKNVLENMQIINQKKIKVHLIIDEAPY